MGRPQPYTLTDFIGQKHILDDLRIRMRAADMRKEPLGHTALIGASGMGKETLIKCLAHDKGVAIRELDFSHTMRSGAIGEVLTNANENDILHIKHIERMNAEQLVIVRNAMQDFVLDVRIGMGSMARTLSVDIPLITVFVTTECYSAIPGPLREAFDSVYRFEPYADAEIAEYVNRYCKEAGIECDAAPALQIAGAANGSMKRISRIMPRLRDYAMVIGNGVITEALWHQLRAELDRDA